jgi:hypothetical protein
MIDRRCDRRAAATGHLQTGTRFANDPVRGHFYPKEAYIMSSKMPPIPPASRGKEPGDDPKVSNVRPAKQQEKHHNEAEEGDTANIKQNTTNKGFFRGRRMG